MRDLSAALYLWITSTTAIAVGYQLPRRLAFLIPIVFALVTLEAQTSGLGSGASMRALGWSLFVVLPCALLGVRLRQVADRRAPGQNKEPPAATSHEVV